MFKLNFTIKKFSEFMSLPFGTTSECWDLAPPHACWLLRGDQLLYLDPIFKLSQFPEM